MLAQEKRRRGGKPLAAVVLALLVLLSAANLTIVKDPVLKLIRQNLSFEEFVDEIQKGYISDDFAWKNSFVNLNGLFARLTGRRTLNYVVRLNNGMLGQPFADLDVTAQANGITGFSDYLREQDIPFLYVQMPYKESLEGQDYPVGVTSYGNKVTDDLLSRLRTEEVETLDLRPRLSQTPEVLERYFAKTDYHWNNDGAFVAFQEILSCLHEVFPDGNIDLTYAQADQWERHSISDWFLGSQGKRVGIFYGGIDPLIWYTPKFETEMSFAVPQYGWFFRGDFTDANIRTRYIEEKDYFGPSAYWVYIGENYPLVQHRNLYAPSPVKVMLIKDSFALPLQAYLSTVFREIDVIDPRAFSDCTVAEYAARTEPDIVILAINPGALNETVYYNYGEETAPRKAEENEKHYEPVLRQDIELEAKDNNFNLTAYPLDANTVYRIAFEGVDIREGQTEGVGLRLYDQTTDTVLESAIFDIAYCEASNGFGWAFRTPDTRDELQLLFYAGIYEYTAGNSVVYRDVTVEKLSDTFS